MAKRKKQSKNHSPKNGADAAPKASQIRDEQVFEPNPRRGNVLLLRIGIILVAVWITVLLTIAFYK